MILDKENEYSNRQALTGTADSTNKIDHLAAVTGLGSGEPMMVMIAFNGVATAGALRVDLETGDNEALSAPDDLATFNIPQSAVVSGNRLYFPLPIGYNAKRFTQLQYTPGSARCTVSAYLLPVDHQEEYRAFPNASEIK